MSNKLMGILLQELCLSAQGSSHKPQKVLMALKLSGSEGEKSQALLNCLGTKRKWLTAPELDPTSRMADPGEMIPKLPQGEGSLMPEPVVGQWSPATNMNSDLTLERNEDCDLCDRGTAHRFHGGHWA